MLSPDEAPVILNIFDSCVFEGIFGASLWYWTTYSDMFFLISSCNSQYFPMEPTAVG